MIDLNEAARAIHKANIHFGIESVYLSDWEDLPSYAQHSYLALAKQVLSDLHIDCVADEQNVDIT